MTVNGQRSDIPTQVPGQTMLPMGTTSMSYECTEHELTFELWQEVLPGRLVRIPYRSTR